MSDSKIIAGALTKGTIIRSSHHEYRVEQVIGSGGFGITYKVIRVSDSRLFAMKEFFPNKLCERGESNRVSYLKINADSFKEGIENFVTEAVRLERENITHPNLISVEEVFRDNGTAYYTMEFIDGINLSQYIKQRHTKPITIEQALSVIRPILQAITLIHKNSLCHYDIKPENIILTVEDENTLRPVLIDFGQAKHYNKKGKATSTLTNAGYSDGYSPLEQYAGLPNFTPQADVYALCATLLFLITAKQPPKASDLTSNKIQDLLPDSIPGHIRQALIYGLRNDKNDRTPTIEALASNLGIDISSKNEDDNVTHLLTLKIRHNPEHKKLVKFIIGIIITIFIACVITWVITRPRISRSELLTRAIAENNLEDLKTFATVEDSSRAFLPYAKCLIKNEDYISAEVYANKALSYEPDAEEARGIIEALKQNQHNFSQSRIPQNSNPDASEIQPNQKKEETILNETDNEKFARAIRTEDSALMYSLARSNYAKAFYPTALDLYNKGLYSQAKEWATAAITANIDKLKAQKLLTSINKHLDSANNTVNNTSNEVIESDEVLFSKAKSIEDFKKLADKGYAKAYAPLAERYFKAKNYSDANFYAGKALKANVNRNEAIKVIDMLEIIGFFDNGENGGKPKY